MYRRSMQLGAVRQKVSSPSNLPSEEKLSSPSPRLPALSATHVTRDSSRVVAAFLVSVLSQLELLHLYKRDKILPCPSTSIPAQLE